MKKDIRLNYETLTKLINCLENNNPQECLNTLRKLRSQVVPFTPAKKVGTKLQLSTKQQTNTALAYKKKLIAKPTKAEVVVKVMLTRMKVKFEQQYVIPYYCELENREKFFLADFYIPSTNTVIEIDGGYHNNPDTKIKDADRTRYIKNRGINNVVRFKNEEVYAEGFQNNVLKKVVISDEVKPKRANKSNV